MCLQQDPAPTALPVPRILCHPHGLLTYLIFTLCFLPVPYSPVLLGPVVPPVICKGSKHTEVLVGEREGKGQTKGLEAGDSSRIPAAPAVTCRDFSNSKTKRNRRAQEHHKGKEEKQQAGIKMENEWLFQEGGGGSKERLRLPGKGFAVTSQSRHGRSWKPLLAPAQLCPAVPGSLCLPTSHTTSLCPQRASSHQTRNRFTPH